MPILSTDQYGGGPLFTFVTSDPNALLKAGVAYYQTISTQNAIVMGLSIRTRLAVEGSIFSNGTGIAVTGTGSAKITVTATGYVGGEVNGISSTGAALDITNSGTIESSGSIAISLANTTLQLTSRVYNSGTIRTNSPFRDAIRLGSGNDEVVNTGTIVGSVTLGQGNNYIDTHLGTVTGRLVGGDGADTFVIAGTEQIVFGGGIDRVVSYGDYALGGEGEILELRGDARRGSGNALANDIVGTDGDDVLKGYGGNDYLLAENGDDLLLGGSGNDTLILGAGNGGAHGGADDDVLFSVEEGEKSLFGEAGNDRFRLDSNPSVGGTNTVFGGTGDDEVRPGIGADTIDGGSDFDTIDYSFAAGAITVNLTTGTGSGGMAEGDRYLNVERVVGTSEADTLIGSARADTLVGNGGADLLQGLAGQDILALGVGDTADGGTGFDTAAFIGDVRVTVNLTTGIAAFETLGTATLIAIENVDGGLGGDTITGSSAINVLRGGAGGDTIDAGRGNDTIDGGTGNDTLTGGLNDDIFLFAEPTHGSDIITDFAAGDTISFLGNSAVQNFAALTITQVNEATMVATPLGDILLQNYTATALTADRFIFADGARGIPDPAPAAMPGEFAV